MIGWQFLVESLIPQLWVSHQNQFYYKHEKLRNGKRWATQMILKLFDIAWDLWEHRNGIVHSTNINLQLEQVNAEVAAAILNGPPTCDADHLFTPTQILTLETALLPTKQAWLALVQAYSQHELKTRKRMSGITGMQTLMHRFLRSK